MPIRLLAAFLVSAAVSAAEIDVPVRGRVFEGFDSPSPRLARGADPSAKAAVGDASRVDLCLRTEYPAPDEFAVWGQRIAGRVSGIVLDGDDTDSEPAVPSPEFLRALGRVPGIRRLYLDRTLGFTDDHAAAFADGWRDLEEFSLVASRYVHNVVRRGDAYEAKKRVGNKLPEALSKLPKLRKVRIEYTAMDGAGLSLLAGMRGLESLRLADNDVAPAGYAGLASAKGLASFAADRAGPDVLAALGGLPRLASVEIGNLSYRGAEAPFAKLAASPSLASLRFLSPDADDGALAAIAASKSLTDVRLRLRAAPVTDAGLAQLLRSCKAVKALGLASGGGPGAAAALAAVGKEGAGIEELELGGFDLTPELVAPLASFPGLRRFAACGRRGSPVRNAALKPLGKSASLRSVGLSWVDGIDPVYLAWIERCPAADFTVDYLNRSSGGGDEYAVAGAIKAAKPEAAVRVANPLPWFAP